MRTRETIEAQSTGDAPQNTQPNTRKGRGDAERIAQWQWKPGQSGNPGGRPKQDLRQLVARAVFENNIEEIYKAYSGLLMSGSAFGFQVVGEAGYGKLKESRDTGAEFNDVPDGQLQEEIERILSRLGLAREADAAAEVGVAAARAEKTL